MGNNVVHVDFTSKKNTNTKRKLKKRGRISRLIKLLDICDDDKSLFLRSLAFRFFI
ncbi:hypothetical protein [Clostridium sp. UBA4548]|uniref:hypothetical protein n=1 Tax=Clostridium sp. UBA4548 TaxID=1946361 RepID=UPI0025BB5A04|nr:hypothetical protein [Clostridium sp. UBA4548]